MLHIFLVFFVFIILLIILWASVYIGREMGLKHLKGATTKKLEVVSVAESAVFGLLALMIAFTFSGAFDRFEFRKMHLLEEASAFRKSYEYVDLLHPKFQDTIRKDMRTYVNLQLDALHQIPDYDKVNDDLSKARVVEKQIWHAAIAACEADKNQNLVAVVLPAISEMFEVAHAGINITKVHPPVVIFVLLLVLAILGAFLVGYNSAEHKQHRPLHSLCYIVLTAFIMYIILNLEFPRVGFITLDTFDQMIIDVRKQMEL